MCIVSLYKCDGDGRLRGSGCGLGGRGQWLSRGCGSLRDNDDDDDDDDARWYRLFFFFFKCVVGIEAWTLLTLTVRYTGCVCQAYVPWAFGDRGRVGGGVLVGTWWGKALVNRTRDTGHDSTDLISANIYHAEVNTQNDYKWLVRGGIYERWYTSSRAKSTSRVLVPLQWRGHH